MIHMNLQTIIIYILSPTFFYAEYKKKKLNAQKRAQFIIKKNKDYFLFSLISFFLFLIINEFNHPDLSTLYTEYINYTYPILFILFYYYFSRVNEIFISFLFDVIDKLNKDYKYSFITFKDRIKLAFHSYFELIINYALMYWMIYFNFGLFNLTDLQLTDFLYYSGVTIATLGYGDIYSLHFVPQFLSVYEVFNGMLLIIVCFTIYVSLNFNEDIHKKVEEFKANYEINRQRIKIHYSAFKTSNKLNQIVAIWSLGLIYLFSFYLLTKIYPTNWLISFIFYFSFTSLLILLLRKTKI